MTILPRPPRGDSAAHSQVGADLLQWSYSLKTALRLSVAVSAWTPNLSDFNLKTPCSGILYPLFDFSRFPFHLVILGAAESCIFVIHHLSCHRFSPPRVMAFGPFCILSGKPPPSALDTKSSAASWGSRYKMA
jgi:hypothetical protein